MNRLFVLSFDANVVRTGHIKYFLPKVEIRYYNVMLMEGAEKAYKHMKILEKLLLIREIIIKLVVY